MDDARHFDFYEDRLGWFVGFRGWMFIAGSLAYCVGVMQEMGVLT